MDSFAVIAHLLDILGEWLIAMATLVLTVMVYRQIKVNQQYYHAVTRPSVLIEYAATSVVNGSLAIMLKNSGVGSAKNLRFWVYPDGESPDPDSKKFLRFLHPKGEHILILGPEDECRNATFHVGLEYEGLDDTQYEGAFEVEASIALGMARSRRRASPNLKTWLTVR